MTISIDWTRGKMSKVNLHEHEWWAGILSDGDVVLRGEAEGEAAVVFLSRANGAELLNELADLFAKGGGA